MSLVPISTLALVSYLYLRFRLYLNLHYLIS
jgi:hypothetical protein